MDLSLPRLLGMPRAGEGWQWVCSAAGPPQQLLCITGKGSSNFSFRQGSALSEEASDWNVTGPGCVMAPWIAACLAACLTGSGLAHGVKQTLSFISEEIQCPVEKQQAFPKTAFYNTVGLKHQYFFQRVSFTETLQTQPLPQARKVQPG